MVEVGDKVVIIADTNFNGLRGVVIEDREVNGEELNNLGLRLIVPLDDRPDGKHGPFYWWEDGLEVVGNERDNPLNLG